MLDLLDYTGKVVLVTGGTRGVGRGIAQRFLEVGAVVWVCGRTLPEEGESGKGIFERFIATDVRDPDAVERMVARVFETEGRLDVLINNAGGSPEVAADVASPRFSEAVLRLNLLAPLYCAQAANRVMQGQTGGGTILSIASVSGMRASPGTAAYGAAKAGLLNLTQTLAVEWAPQVRINAVVAGMIRTEQSALHYGDEEGMRRVEATVPLGRLGEPRDVADACLFLASPLACYITGASLLLHGGGENPAFLRAREG